MKLSGSSFCFVFFFLVCACMVRTILTGTVVHRYTVYRYQLRHLKYDHEVICILRSLLTANTPTQERLATLPVTTSPTLFEQWCGFFYVRQEPDKWAGTYGFSSLSEIPFLQTKILKKQCTLLNFSTRRVNAVLFGTAEVTSESFGRNLMVWPFKRILFHSTFTWYYLSFSIFQN